MKKYLLGIFARCLAIGVCALAPKSDKTFSLWYKDGTQFFSFSGTPCPADDEIQCEVNIPNVGTRPLYTQPDDLHPYLTRE